MPMAKELFHGTGLAKYIEARWANLERLLNLASEAELAASAAVIDPQVSVQFPTLDRVNAELRTAVASGGVLITCRIPFTGDWQFLEMPVVTGGQHPVIPGELVGQGRFDSAKTLVEMKQDFATDVAPGQTKEWAGKRADQIEAELALLRPEVEAAMARLRPRGEKHAAERLAAKQTQRRLDDGPPQMCDLDLRRVRAAAASPIGCRARRCPRPVGRGPVSAP